MTEPLKIYNSLSRKVEDFTPRDPAGKKVQMFVCGPTVYDYIHIGNARTFTIFDVVAKWLRYRGYDVDFVQNITDIDDRIIARATEKGRSPQEHAKEFEQYFLEDMKALGNDAVSRYARATDHIEQVKKQVKTLIAKKNVYLIGGDGWYFDLTTFPDYGKLSGRTGMQANDAISRIDDSEKKRHAGDFCVWKLSKPGEPIWEDAELGAGRPGWHIEDTAITEHYFGPQYDIHGGGMDLKFPHHEAEIAQQEAASGLVPFVKYWMHAGFLETSEQKMSKSLGNFLTLRNALEKYDPAVLRFYFLSNHYRAPLEFNEQSLNAAQAAVQRIHEVLLRLDTVATLRQDECACKMEDATARARTAIEEAMNDDFNTSRAFAALFNLISNINDVLAQKSTVPDAVASTKTFFTWVAEVFGIMPTTSSEVPSNIRKLVEKRQAAREDKDFEVADKLRAELEGQGYSIDDTPYGPLVKKK